MITFFSKKDRMGNVTVVPVREEKRNIWQEEIYEMCVDSLVSGNIPKPEVIEIFFKNILWLLYLRYIMLDCNLEYSTG